MIVFATALIVLGAALIAMRKISGSRGAAGQNAFFGKDLVKPAWIEAWNLLFGGALVVAGLVIAVAALL